MGISINSINTGLPKDIVEQLMKAQRAPIMNLESRKGEIKTRKTLMQQLIEHVRKLADSPLEADKKGFRDLTHTLSREGVIAVDVDKKTAEPGEYNIEVVQLAGRNSARSNGFPDKDRTEVGIGFISFETPEGEERELFLDANPNTLENIAKQINENSKEFGFRANVINDGSKSETPWRLILSGTSQGMDNKVAWPEFYFLDGDMDLFVEGERGAQNAIVRMDGFEVQYPSNKITDLIPGVAINLLEAQPGREVNLSIKEDIEEISKKLDDLVKLINEVLGFIKKQNDIDGNTNTFQTLAGDSSLQSVESRLRTLILLPRKVGEPNEDDEYRTLRLSDIGIRFERSGLLKFDQETFKQEIRRDFTAVADLFVGDGRKMGFIPELKETSKQYTLTPYGILTMREKGFQGRIDNLDKQIAQKEQHLERVEENLKSTFANLESTMSQLKAQGGSLAAFGGGGGALAGLSLK